MCDSDSDGDDKKDVFEKDLDRGDSACMEALESNWDGLLAATILEIIQWSWDFLDFVIKLPAYALMQLPFIGLPFLWGKYVFGNKIYADWSRTYAHGAQADVRMARNNSRCASNIYVAFGKSLKPDYKFAGDTEFYLNSISAAQSFYVGFMDWHEHMGWLYTLWPIGPLSELVYRGATLALPIVTLML